MREYEKIETIYMREEGTGKKDLLMGVWRNPTIRFLRNNTWEWTEKIDGSNISVHWDGHKVEFFGRTERAQIPAELVNKLNELFGGEINEEIFEQKFGDTEVILYGEGYGRKIQNGGAYIPDGVNFILFDVFIGGVYLKREDVEDIARSFDINCVPVVLRGDIATAIRFVQSKPLSTIGTAPMEGLVGRPVEELRDRMGRRVIVKVKVRDFHD